MNELQQIQKTILQCQKDHSLLPYWQETLFDPLNDFFARPRKDLRGRLIEIGFELGFELANPKGSIPFSVGENQRENMDTLRDLLEAFHSGSLIVDDIQDRSEVRRGDESLHLRYGVPVALNAGNWLYFLAYRLIERLQVSADLKLRYYKVVTDTLYGAHFGQALDVGQAIDQVPWPQQVLLCQRSLELKSGLLVGLALQLGAMLSDCSEEQLKKIYQFGVEFGVSLQRFDDLGNLNVVRPTAKHLEDLSLKRPSWIWGYLAEFGTDEERAGFTSALKVLPEVAELREFLKNTDFKQKCYEEASRRLQAVIESLSSDLKMSKDAIVMQRIQKIGDQLTYAYK